MRRKKRTTRNRLGIAKVNEEMVIKVNTKSKGKNINTFQRIQNVFCDFEKNYDNVWKCTSQEVKTVIDMVDNFVNGPSLPQNSNQQSTIATVTPSRKTKLFKLIVEDRGYLPKKAFHEISIHTRIICYRR
jgi:hypothetical protein